MRRTARYAAGATLLLAAGATQPACNDRFAFDVPATGPGATGGAGGGAGGSRAGAAGSPASGEGGLSGAATAGTGGAGAGAGGTSAAGAGSPASGGAAGSGPCGIHPPCPADLHCSAGECYECTADVDCAASTLLRCDLQRKRCVECLETSDCAAGFACDALGNRCLRRCSDDLPCPSDLHGCDERRGVCYACDEDRECEDSPLGPLCADDGSGCVTCRTDDDCPNQRCDPLSGRCVECRDGKDCASGWCDPANGVCLVAP